MVIKNLQNRDYLLQIVTGKTEAIDPWLEDSALIDGRQATTNLRLLHAELDDLALLEAILCDALASADPDAALNLLERLFSRVDRGQLNGILASAEQRRQLITILGGSQFLANICCRHASQLPGLFSPRGISSAMSEVQMLEQLRDKIPDGTDFDSLQSELRRFKARQILRIGSRDLCGLASLEEVMEELSSLATASLQRASEICELQLQAEYGEPLQDEEDGSQNPASMTILGMGKLGGNELNFSSDIDLIYCYSSNRGETRGGSRNEKISLHRYFVKLAELITRALHQVTADGFVFRVDTRLRPDGNNGDLAISVRGAEAYYEAWGQSWERAAMLKARPVAGDIKLGEELLNRLRPFIFRKYLDFGMLEDIKLMKQKINASLSREREGERNLKLGFGGIREIEFFIQALQLVNAGKCPQLQQRNSLQVLNLLCDEQLIDCAESLALAKAYRFLRNVEHRIQIVHEQQTHMLPADPRELEVLARRSGFSDYPSFKAELERHRNAVNAIFRELFHSADAEEVKLNPEVSFIFDPEADIDLVKDLLESKGFSNPDAAYDSLKLLREGDPQKRMTRRDRRSLEKLAPLVLNELLASPNPDQALNNLDDFLNAIKARSSFFSLLVENSAIVKVLIALFGSSQLLSRIFIQRPELLDTMVSHSHAIEKKTRGQMMQELGDQLAQGADFEIKLDLLRRYRNEEFLRIALNDLNGQMSNASGALQLSWLAETCLEYSCAMARQELVTRFGAPFTAKAAAEVTEETAFAVVGMGKLGGHELNYHSDLDIIFIYEQEGRTRPVAGTDPKRFRQIGNHEYFAKLAQRIITILSLVTREGFVYKIDTRLRPSGNQGPLVTNLRSFTAYHQESAQPWERQAMTKARVVCGPKEFKVRLQHCISRLTFERPLPENLQQEIYRLRERMEQEIAKESQDLLNIKTGRGGMVDVEFITQYLQLRFAGQINKLRTQNSIRLLEVMAEEELIPRADAKSLINNYKFLRRLENKLRLLHDQSINELSAQKKDLRKIVRSLGYVQGLLKPEEQFLNEYRQVTESVRKLLEKYLKPCVAEGPGGHNNE
jgi:glutamate-ammonia-ligase adenylyltransferase